MADDDPAARAEAAREHARRTGEAAERARNRLRQGHGSTPLTAAEAEERRLLAEDRVHEVRASLRDSLERSASAHDAAADADDRAGKTAHAEEHRQAAESDRLRVDDVSD